ncbi:MAG: hypothetical protein HRU75_01985 [Planctomycetia bacterium]|nr:MAG: hypothetical protein HRU75_01985 [Planctomycetia bacterium]
MDSGNVAVASDDYTIYKIKNDSSLGLVWNYRPPGRTPNTPLDACGDRLSWSFSASIALYQGDLMMVRDEFGRLSLIGSMTLPSGSQAASLVGRLQRDSHEVLGTSVVDRLRFYQPHVDGGIRVLKRSVTSNDPECPADIDLAWGWRPPGLLNGHFRGAPAIDVDGTFYCVSNGRIFALRPLRGDFNGDGCRNNFDVDAFVLSLTDRPEWDIDFGDKYGLNLLGIGDCNEDGVFNNFDIDCIIDLLINDATPCGDEGYTICEGEPEGCGEMLSGGGESSGSGGVAAMESSQSDDCNEVTDTDMEHFWTMVTALRAHFGMNP